MTERTIYADFKTTLVYIYYTNGLLKGMDTRLLVQSLPPTPQ